MAMDLEQYTVIYRVHALKRMFERDISEIEVSDILEHGDVINEYPDDYPYPSKLIKGFSQGKILHVLIAENTSDNEIIVITVYEPDPNLWDSEFRRKIK
ncbi:MAG: DUF4258 domain-containing protein [Ignavibacteriales bacterium]|nr:DUF4258 domain-containing protein [Ignavibacteriales bacterium]